MLCVYLFFFYRSLGDGDFKKPTSEENFVSAEPYVHEMQLTKSASFLLLACDGLFDKLTAQDAVNFVHEQLQQESSLSTVANQLTEHALNMRTTDNVSVVLVQFKWK